MKKENIIYKKVILNHFNTNLNESRKQKFLKLSLGEEIDANHV